jgi:hypothetical protein
MVGRIWVGKQVPARPDLLTPSDLPMAAQDSTVEGWTTLKDQATVEGVPL